jgi:hypothetical protein
MGMQQSPSYVCCALARILMLLGPLAAVLPWRRHQVQGVAAAS